MATIEWRAGKRGRYAYLQWSDNDGQHRQSLGAISEEEAETRRIVKDAELRTGKRILSTAPLVGVVAVMYLEWHRAQFPDSHYRTAQIVNDHIVPAFRYVAADQLAIRQVEKWGNDRAQVVASSSAAKEVRTLKAMLNWAIRNAIIDYAPATKATPPQDVVSRPMHWYSMEELQALYGAATWRAVWQLMVNTGMRRGEASLLRWTNVKPDSLLLLSEEEARTKRERTGRARDAEERDRLRAASRHEERDHDDVPQGCRAGQGRRLGSLAAPYLRHAPGPEGNARADATKAHGARLDHDDREVSPRSRAAP
jgi:integrase